MHHHHRSSGGLISAAVAVLLTLPVAAHSAQATTQASAAAGSANTTKLVGVRFSTDANLWLRLAGRAHPLVVHFPIALLFAALLFEILGVQRRRIEVVRMTADSAEAAAAKPVLSVRGPSEAGYACLLLGVLTAAAAISSGWFNADFESHGTSADATIFWHRWTAIGAGALALLAALIGATARRRIRMRAETDDVPLRPATLSVYRLSLVLNVILLCAAGHFGGSLVYGDDYLTALLRRAVNPPLAPSAEEIAVGPTPAASPAPIEPVQATDVASPASAAPESSASSATPRITFVTHIAPIVSASCYQCHGEEEQRGGLRLDLREEVFGPDKSAWVIQPGRSADSMLVKLISLPAGDPDIMPAKGDPLKPEQIALIRAWIDQGAPWTPDEATREAAAAAPSPAAEAPTSAGPGPQTARRAAPPPAEQWPRLSDAQRHAIQERLAAIRARGGLAEPIASSQDVVQVQFARLGKDATDADLALLDGLASSLVWLDLSGTGVSDDGLKRVARFTALRRLRLDHTGIGDAGLKNLRPLKQLAYLNLVGTDVTNDGMAELLELPALRQLYLWQTRVSAAGVAGLKAANRELTIELGDLTLPPNPPLAPLAPPAHTGPQP
ncbi:MAG: hypothetical protein CHACPFDD_02384 [Phycisphaerae bacterium]|nr:hypothetical protein [Phycisphaerae bacterium]